MEAGLDAETVYNPPNLTFPFGAYICVVDVDPGTAQVTVRRFIAVDDCGTRINPMIIEGQVHGGLTDGVGMALMELIAFDEEGNCLGGSLMDYLIPSAIEVPDWETDFTVTPLAPSSVRRQGHRRIRNGRLAAGHRQCRGRCAAALRRAAHRHALHAVTRVGRDAGPGGAAAMILPGHILGIPVEETLLGFAPAGGVAVGVGVLWAKRSLNSWLTRWHPRRESSRVRREEVCAPAPASPFQVT